MNKSEKICIWAVVAVWAYTLLMAIGLTLYFLIPKGVINPSLLTDFVMKVFDLSATVVIVLTKLSAY